MTIEELYYAFIFGLLHGTVVIKNTITTADFYGNVYEAQKGKVPTRICSLYYNDSSKGRYIQFVYNGETLDNIWKFIKNELDPVELLRIDVNNAFFDQQVKWYYGP
jgi:hypothetical protein